VQCSASPKRCRQAHQRNRGPFTATVDGATKGHCTLVCAVPSSAVVTILDPELNVAIVQLGAQQRNAARHPGAALTPAASSRRRLPIAIGIPRILVNLPVILVIR